MTANWPFHRTLDPSACPLQRSHGRVKRRSIDSPQGRRRYGKRIGTVEPVFGNLRHNKRLNRFTLRGHEKVSTQWQLYCMVHNIEKVAGT